MVGLALVNFVAVNVLLVTPGSGKEDSLMGVVRMVAKVDAAALLLASAWMGFASIIHSHRIAGAMYSISRTLKQVLSGDGDIEVRLRKEDFSTDVAKRINALIALVDEYKGKLKLASQAREAPESQSEADAEAGEASPGAAPGQSEQRSG